MSTPDARPGLTSRLIARAERHAEYRKFRKSVQHVSGPRTIPGGSQDVTVIALVRDAGFYLTEFLLHYRALGAKHFIFCDNGSQDGAVNRLKGEPDTTVLQWLLPFRDTENHMRRHAAETYCKGRWILYADADELFDYRSSTDLKLSGLTKYLDDHNFTAMVAQMVEMFPKGPIAEHTNSPYAQVLSDYTYFDLTDARSVSYFDPEIRFHPLLIDNTIQSDTLKFYFGGVRSRVFGEDCCLTKHPLVHVGHGVRLGVNPHCASGVRCADITGLIRHYKFSNNPFARDMAAVKAGEMGHGEDRLRRDVVRNNPDVSLWSASAKPLSSIDILYDEGFLLTTPQFDALRKIA